MGFGRRSRGCKTPPRASPTATSCEKSAEAYYRYDHDPSLRAAILFGHGENFSRSIDFDGPRSLAGTGKPWIASKGTIAWAVPDLIEAAAPAGNTKAAHKALVRLSGTARAGGTEQGLGLEARSLAVLRAGEASDRFYRVAIDPLSRARLRPELARCPEPGRLAALVGRHHRCLTLAESVPETCSQVARRVRRTYRDSTRNLNVGRLSRITEVNQAYESGRADGARGASWRCGQ
jgi:hypothetical protein